MTIVALDSGDVAAIIKALSRKGEAEIPARWQKAAAALDVAAPFILLRKFARPAQMVMQRDPKDLSNVEITQVPIDSFGMTSDFGSQIRFRLRIVSPKPDVAWLYFQGGTFHAGFRADYWKWTQKTDPDGMTADVDSLPKDKANHSDLIIITLFGISVGV